MKIFVGIITALAACGFDPSFDPGALDGGGADAPLDAHIAGPSCSGLTATCGSDGTDDCCSIAEPIPGGTFYRSFDYGSDGMYADMSFPATVSPFVLDKYEVTVGRFRKFVEAGMGTQASSPAPNTGARTLNGMQEQGGWDSSWDEVMAPNTSALRTAVQCDAAYQTWTDAAGSNESLPMNCVTWYEAFAFCVWDEGFTPSEAESDFAAAGGSEQRAYPWSVPATALGVDCTYANYDISMPSGVHCVGGSEGSVNRVGAESPKGDGKWGQSDLGGNVVEWVLDWFAPLTPPPCEDCANLTDAPTRGTRGGGFYLDVTYLRASVRYNADPSTRYAGLGMRCARAR